METKTRYKNGLKFCHVKSDGSGSAFSMKLTKSKKDLEWGDDVQCPMSILFQVAPQKPGTKIGDTNIFDYNKESSIFFKPTILEVCQLIAVLNDKKKCTGDDKNRNLIHKLNEHTTTLSLSKADNGNIYYLNLNRKIDQSSLSVKFSFFEWEAVAFRMVLEHAFHSMIDM